MRKFLMSSLVLLLPFMIGCPQSSNIFADDDNDGWYTQDNNWATDLILSTATFSESGNYRIIVDDVRFPLDPTLASIDRSVSANANVPLTLGVHVAKRVHGTNILRPTTRARMEYAAVVRVQKFSIIAGPQDIGTATVNFHSEGNQTIPVRVTQSNAAVADLVFTTTSTRFADPNPNDPSGDVDSDGITEREEAVLAEFFGGLGDPRTVGRDIVLIVSWPEPAWALDPLTQELLKSRFFQRGINLHIDNGTMNGSPGFGGLISNRGGLPPGAAFSLTDALNLRNLNIPADRRRYTRFALFASGVDIGGYGVGNAIPGNRLVMKAQLYPLSPSYANYQSGVLMHELGHLLGLCHPSEHTGTSSCPAIPLGERDPGGSVMGTPAENSGIMGAPLAVINTLRRPLDYSATQWTLLRIGSGLVQ